MWATPQLSVTVLASWLLFSGACLNLDPLGAIRSERAAEEVEQIDDLGYGLRVCRDRLLSAHELPRAFSAESST
jgi:hypothetical protein